MYLESPSLIFYTLSKGYKILKRTALIKSQLSYHEYARFLAILTLKSIEKDS